MRIYKSQDPERIERVSKRFFRTELRPGEKIISNGDSQIAKELCSVYGKNYVDTTLVSIIINNILSEKIAWTRKENGHDSRVYY